MFAEHHISDKSVKKKKKWKHILDKLITGQLCRKNPLEITTV